MIKIFCFRPSICIKESEDDDDSCKIMFPINEELTLSDLRECILTFDVYVLSHASQSIHSLINEIEIAST